MKTILLFAAAAFLVGVLVAPAMIHLLRRLKFGQKILEDGPTWHMSKQNTPTMGGLIFIIGIAAALALYALFFFRNMDLRPLLMLALSLVFGAIGYIDDYTKIKKKQNKGLTAMQKLLLQIAAAALFLSVLRSLGYITASLYIPFIGITLHLPWIVYLLLSTFIIVGAVNAVNLTDGIDGLCTGVTFVVAVYFCMVFAQSENGVIPGVFSGALAGSLLAFYLYNKNPARVFMGDTGSLFLGGAVCAMAFAYNMPMILVPVGIIYIIEALSDIIQVAYFKISGGKRVFKMAPIHHHFEMCGWSEKKIVAVATLITLALCALAYLFA